jgi:hypothetical protein
MAANVPPWTPREMDPKGDLCLHCIAILDEMIWPVEQEVGEDERILAEITGSPRIRNITVGWVDTLIATKACNLCRFFVRRFERRFSHKKLAEACDDRRFWCYIPQGYMTRRLKSGMRLSWHMSVSFAEYEADGMTPKARRAWRPLFNHAQNITLLEDSLPALARLTRSVDEDLVFDDLARRRTAAAWNSGMMREALRICFDIHPEACGIERGLLTRTWYQGNNPRLRRRRITPLVKAMPEGFRVIDVRDMCIRSTRERTQHIALSYCWSAKKYLCLTKLNFIALHEKRSIDLETLAPTIADAITVTRELGERFLWVDALCITQDDERDKAGQIGKMHLIYQFARLTIIAAGSPGEGGADLGLPGVSRTAPRPEQDVVEIRGLAFTERWSNDWDELKQVRWVSPFYICPKIEQVAKVDSEQCTCSRQEDF